jgi:hypothetical protein
VAIISQREGRRKLPGGWIAFTQVSSTRRKMKNHPTLGWHKNENDVNFIF